MRDSCSSTTCIPDIVKQCKQLAEANHFAHSCSDDTGRLLRILSGQITEGKILEIGTGFGVGASWIISALSPEVSFYSVDIKQSQIEKVQREFTQPNVYFQSGDWKAMREQGPFRFVFADAAGAKNEEAVLLYHMVDSRGLLLLDDLTPEEFWPDEWKGKPDPLREYWLNHPGWAAQEIMLTPKEACILAVKLE